MFSKKNYFLALFLFLGSFCDEVEVLQIDSSIQPTSRDQNAKKNTTKKDKIAPAKEIYVVKQEDLLSKTALHSEMMTQIQEMQIKFNKEAADLTREFEEKKSEYEKKAATSTREALAPLEEKLKSLMQKMSEIDASYRDLFQNIEKTYIERVFAEIEIATKSFLLKYANSEAVIVASGPGIFVHSKFDITDEIIASINANISKSSNEKNEKDSKKSASKEDVKKSSKESKK